MYYMELSCDQLEPLSLRYGGFRVRLTQAFTMQDKTDDG